MKWRIYLVNGAYGGEEDQFPTMRPLRLIPILETLHNCWQADKDLFFNPKPSRSVLAFHSCQTEAVWKEIKQLYLMIWVHFGSQENAADGLYSISDKAAADRKVLPSKDYYQTEDCHEAKQFLESNISYISKAHLHLRSRWLQRGQNRRVCITSWIIGTEKTMWILIHYFITPSW